VIIDARTLRCAPLVAMLGVALATAGCGSAGTHSATSADATSTETVTQTATSTPSPTTSAASATTSSPSTTGSSQAQAATATCVSTQLTVSVGAGTAGLGHVGEPLRFHNVGSAACVLTGYPGVALIRSGGRQLQAKRTPNGYLGGLSAGSQASPVLEVRPGETVSALLEGTDSQGGSGGPCPSYVALLVTPPNLRVSRRIARAFAVCEPTVHPVVAGASGRQG
jgi:Protein of unknown function (DUF4232)